MYKQVKPIRAFTPLNEIMARPVCEHAATLRVHTARTDLDTPHMCMCTKRLELQKSRITHSEAVNRYRAHHIWVPQGCSAEQAVLSMKWQPAADLQTLRYTKRSMQDFSAPGACLNSRSAPR